MKLTVTFEASMCTTLYVSALAGATGVAVKTLQQQSDMQHRHWRGEINLTATKGAHCVSVSVSNTAVPVVSYSLNCIVLVFKLLGQSHHLI